MKLTTTFKKLHEAGACKSRYTFLREALPNVTDDESINLLTILETNGLDDALWALRATEQNCDRVARLMAADFAEQVIPIWQKYSATNNRPQLAIKAARDFAKGLITEEQLSAESAAAWSASWDARDNAIAAMDAARATWAAALSAARAPWAAALYAARAARAAGDAALYAAREKQREIFISYLKEGK